METIKVILEAAPAWVVAITGLVTAASAIAALTPTKKDDKIFEVLKKVLNVLALNVKHAKPADEKEASESEDDK